MYRKLLLAVSGLFLVVAGYAAGSGASFAICLSSFSPPALGTALIFWDSLEQKDKAYRWTSVVQVFLLIVWLSVFGMFAVTNLPTRELVIAHEMVTLRETPLRGIEVQPKYEKAVFQLRELYKSNGCQNVSLVTLDNVPMVYFILQRSMPNEFGVVRPVVYFPEEQVRGELNLQRGWCVLDVTTSETQALINTREYDNRANLRSWIKRESQRVFQISSPSNEISDLQLYVRDAAQVRLN